MYKVLRSVVQGHL